MKTSSKLFRLTAWLGLGLMLMALGINAQIVPLESAEETAITDISGTDATGEADAAGSDEQIVETEVEETVEEDVPGQPGKKVRKKRKRKIRRRVKRKGKKGGKGARGKKGAQRDMPARAKHPSQMTAQERFQRRSRILKGQKQRRMQRIGMGAKKPMSNLQKLQAMQLKRQLPGAHKKHKASRPTQGLTSKRIGGQGVGAQKPAPASAHDVATSEEQPTGEPSEAAEEAAAE